MDPVGITNACTSVVVPNSRSKIVTAHSAMLFRTGSRFSGVSRSSLVEVTLVVVGFAMDLVRLYRFVSCSGSQADRGELPGTDIYGQCVSGSIPRSPVMKQVGSYSALSRERES